MFSRTTWSTAPAPNLIPSVLKKFRVPTSELSCLLISPIAAMSSPVHRPEVSASAASPITLVRSAAHSSSDGPSITNSRLPVDSRMVWGALRLGCALGEAAGPSPGNPRVESKDRLVRSRVNIRVLGFFLSEGPSPGYPFVESNFL